MHTLGPPPPQTRIRVSAPGGEYTIVLGHGLLGQIGDLVAREASVRTEGRAALGSSLRPRAGEVQAREVQEARPHDGVGSGPYPLPHVKPEQVLQEGLGRKVAIVTDSNVAPLYAGRLTASLVAAGFEPSIVTIQTGEEHKNLGSVNAIVEDFLDASLDRSGWVIALGGGVVGDTAGLAASIYMRGLPLVQVPTTLLAMADSSIGGKVGVDHPRGKNLLGAFKQPHLVVADLDTLSSLPAEQIACGMAEIIKAGIIGDSALFALLEESGRAATINYMDALHRAIEVKRGIVERDPYEAGERALLNLGHTFGHAFEKCASYRRLHGFAVAQGMVVAFRLAETLGMCSATESKRVEEVLQRWGLPVRWGAPDLTSSSAMEQAWDAMSTDKKRLDGRLRLVLPERIGKVRLVDDVPQATIMTVLKELQ